MEQRLKAEEYRQLALFDPLTGVYNRRAAEARIAEEIKRCTRRGVPLTVAVLDLDDFKNINDNHGHMAGDLALKEFALNLKRASRGSDVVARLGGDEFLLILPECTPTQLRIVLRRLEPLEIEYQSQRIRISFCAGWTNHSPGETPEQLMHNADQALYAKKRVATPAPTASPN
jgi:diguanylate cyclase (GGDEF)-like protein